MASADQLKTTIRKLYAARVAGDLSGLTAEFADDVMFEFNGKGADFPGLSGPVSGKSEVAKAMEGLFDAFRFHNWRERSLIVEGDRAALHWHAQVTFTPTGHSDDFDVMDLFTFRDGKVVELRQSTDTAQVKTLVAR
jgi:ketosteroid isomerase-like protein